MALDWRASLALALAVIASAILKTPGTSVSDVVCIAFVCLFSQLSQALDRPVLTENHSIASWSHALGTD